MNIKLGDFPASFRPFKLLTLVYVNISCTDKSKECVIVSITKIVLTPCQRHEKTWTINDLL